MFLCHLVKRVFYYMGRHLYRPIAFYVHPSAKLANVITIQIIHLPKNQPEIYAMAYSIKYDILVDWKVSFASYGLAIIELLSVQNTCAYLSTIWLIAMEVQQ